MMALVVVAFVVVVAALLHLIFGVGSSSYATSRILRNTAQAVLPQAAKLVVLCDNLGHECLDLGVSQRLRYILFRELEYSMLVVTFTSHGRFESVESLLYHWKSMCRERLVLWPDTVNTLRKRYSTIQEYLQSTDQKKVEAFISAVTPLVMDMTHTLQQGLRKAEEAFYGAN